MKYIALPSTYDAWPEIRGHLAALSSRTKRGPEGFQCVLERGGEGVALDLLDKVLDKAEYITGERFYDELLPWIAEKALEVDLLFKESNDKILVSSIHPL